MLSTKQTFTVGMGEKPFEPTPDDPKFIFRYPTCEEWTEFAAIAEEKHVKDMEDDANMAECLAAIRKYLRGWENVQNGDAKSIPFDPAALDRVIVPADLWRLYWLVRAGARLRPDQQKKSESPSPTASAKSATDAAASSPVPMPPAPQNP